MVGNVKGVIVLDNEGRRIIAKYYNQERNKGLENNALQKHFEKICFQKSNKTEGGSKTTMFENDVMNVDDYVAVFRCYTDMTIFVIGDGKQDNELILASVLDCINECFEQVFKHNIERKSLINNMSQVILVIDELIDNGIIMNLDHRTILSRINSKGDQGAPVGEQPQASGLMGMFGGGGAQASSESSSMFSSIFSAARGQVSKTLAL